MLIGHALLVLVALSHVSAQCNPSPSFSRCSSTCPDAFLTVCLICQAHFWPLPPCANTYPPGLQYVNYEFNSFTTISADAFANTTLQSIDLRFNRITEIAVDAFWTLPSLQQLYVADNHLTAIDPSMMSQFTSLQLFFAMNNRLTSIDPSTFQPFAATLQLLDLHGNKISVLVPGTLSSMSSLQQMSLRSNPLTQLSPDLFADLVSLQQLYIYETNISSVEANTFSAMSSLQILDFSLTGPGLKLEAGAFAGIPDIVPSYNKSSNSGTGLWLVSNANMIISSEAFGNFSSFFCGASYYEYNFEICDATACATQCGSNSQCQVTGWLTPVSEFNCL